RRFHSCRGLSPRAPSPVVRGEGWGEGCAAGPHARWLVGPAQRTPHPTASRPPSPLTRGEGKEETASDSRVPIVAVILPVSPLATVDVGEAFDQFDAPHIFGHLVAELTFDADAERGAVGDGEGG